MSFLEGIAPLWNGEILRRERKNMEAVENEKVSVEER